MGGFYQPPRLSQGTGRSQHTRHETVRDQASQQRMQRNGQAARRAPSSMMADTQDGMMADQTGSSQRLCIIQTVGPDGETMTERRQCSAEGEVSMPVVEEENTTAPCCLSREQLHNMFLRCCCGTKRYNGRQYSQRMC